MSRKAAVRALVSRALVMQRDSEGLADWFAEKQSGLVRRQLGEFFGRLQVGILRNLKRKGGREYVLGMLADLDVHLDMGMIGEVYESTAEDVSRYIRTAEKLVRKAEPQIEFVFDEIDNATLEMIRNSFFWMKADHSEALIAEVKAVIEAAFAGEVARDVLPKLLEEKFGVILHAESRYFKDVSDHIISQGQNMARVAQGAKYEVQWYKVMARMDSRTTEFCRSVNGKLISAAHVEKQGKKILGAKNTAQKKESAAWPKKDGPLKGTLPKNIGIPPYHYRCRTILQPYWPDEYEIAKLRIA